MSREHTTAFFTFIAPLHAAVCLLRCARRHALSVVCLSGVVVLLAGLGAGASGQAGKSAGPSRLFASVFQDHAVLQRDRPVRLWGRAAPGERVRVAFNGHEASAAADDSGRWEVTLPAVAAGGPYTLEARSDSGTTQVVSDILVGDVFVCSGQSNMEYPVVRARGGESAVRAAANDRIRLLTVPHRALAEPAADPDAPGTWRVASPETVRTFSAVCYFFARELQQTEQVPMGLITAAWGGSAIEAWIGPSGFEKAGDFARRLELLRLYARDPDAANQGFGRMWEAWWRSTPAGTTELWQPALAGADSWPEVPEPMRNWKTWGVPELAKHDGMVWYRRAFRLTAEQARRRATLSLGGIDEVDQTWVNGRVIRNTFGWGDERVYPLPAGVLRPGENVVTLNVLSTWDAGGMVGPAEKLALTLDDGTTVPLAGGWRYQAVPLEIGRPPRAPWEPIAGLTTLYNGMIAPLGPYGLRGVVWYQGETNADVPAGYQELLAGLMSSWRDRFGAGLPFLIVQLPGFGPVPTTPVESNWAEVREAQRRAVAADNRAGLVVTIDLGERDDIHPIEKRAVGSRVARAARRVVYGQAVAPSGPVPLSATREADGVVVTFEDVEGHLVTYSSDRAIGFELCGEGKGSCRYTTGRVASNRVALAPVEGHPSPARVRFCWGDSPLCNLSDQSGLPVGPFELVIK